MHHDFVHAFRVAAPAALRPAWTEVKAVRSMPRAEFALLPGARFARRARKLEVLRAR